VERRRPTPLRCLVASPLPSAPPPLPLLSSLPYHSPLCAVVPRLTARPAATSLPFCPGMTIGRVWFLYCIQYRFHIPVCEECRVHIAPVPFPGRLVVRVVVSTSYPLLPSAPSGKMLPPSENTCPPLLPRNQHRSFFGPPLGGIFLPLSNPCTRRLCEVFPPYRRKPAVLTIPLLPPTHRPRDFLNHTGSRGAFPRLRLDQRFFPDTPPSARGFPGWV